jgi:hypothetical protein
MEHFSMEKWIDFARNLVGAQEKSAMQSHLESGCKQCTKVLNLWQHVHEVARHERSFEPPASAVSTVKGNFALHGPRKAHRGVRAMAELLFDSSLSPQPVGVRSNAPTARQLLFGTGNYRIDVRIEPQAGSNRVAVIGQVLRFADPAEGIASVPVALTQGRKALAKAVTNRFGEFTMECDLLLTRLHLRVNLPLEELQLPLIVPVSEPNVSVLLSVDSKAVSMRDNRRKKRTRKKV